MAEATLDEVQRLVDQLTLLDQAQLLEYLAPRIAQAVAASQANATTSTPGNSDAWTEFFRLGDALAASDSPEGATLTATVLAMRR
jgi:hypothetical protein